MSIEKRPELGSLATFIPNKHLPVYNWFYFKEGFARDFVMMMLDEYVNKGMKDGTSGMNNGTDRSRSVNVLDPFMGSGTTLLACKERGLDSYGFDVSPLAVLASRAKTNDYDAAELQKAIKEMSKSRFERQDIRAVPENTRRFFNPHTLEDVLFFRKQVGQFGGEINDFLKLGLITSATRCSYMFKDGAVLKIRKKPVPVFRKFYIRTLRNMLNDTQKIRFRPCQTFVEEGDARNLRIDTEFIDLVITSPPYLNKIEYTRIYGVEEYLFFGFPWEKRGMRSYIGRSTWTGGISGEGVGLEPEAPAEKAYFDDIKRVMSELRRVCKPGAIVAMVIGDGCFPEEGMVIRMADRLPGIAEEEGFDTESIAVLNERWCTRRRVEKIAKMDESLIIMRKRE